MCTMTPRASVCKRQIRVSEILKVKTFDLIQLLGLLELFLLTGFAHCIIQSCVFCFLTIVYERLCTEWKWTGCQTKVSICSVLCVNYKRLIFEQLLKQFVPVCIQRMCSYLSSLLRWLALSCVKELSWCHSNTYGIVCCTLCLCRSLNKSTRDVETVFDLVCSSGPYAKKETNKWEAL